MFSDLDVNDEKFTRLSAISEEDSQDSEKLRNTAYDSAASDNEEIGRSEEKESAQKSQLSDIEAHNNRSMMDMDENTMDSLMSDKVESSSESEDESEKEDAKKTGIYTYDATIDIHFYKKTTDRRNL